MSIFSSYKKIFLLGFIVIILAAIPLSVYIAQERQQTQSKAAASTTLSFEPASPTLKVGEKLTLNIWLNPGTGTDANQVSFVKLSIGFDPAKFATIAGSLRANPDPSNSLQTPVGGLKFESGKVTLSLSVGASPEKVVIKNTKIAIFELMAISTTTTTPSKIVFNPAPNTQILSIDRGSQTSDNVLSSADDATVTIANASTTTIAAPPASASGIPVCTSLNVDRSTTGTAPYPITFTASGNDPDGTINKVSINFGDGPIQVLTTGGGLGTNSINAQISHTYNTSGTFTAYAILTDNANNLSTQQASCSKTITINSSSALGSGSSSQLQTEGTDIIDGTLPDSTVPSESTGLPTITIPSQVILPPTGPGMEMFGIGILGTVFVIVGGILLLL